LVKTALSQIVVSDDHAVTHSIPSSYSGGWRFQSLPRKQLNDPHFSRYSHPAISHNISYPVAKVLLNLKMKNI
jgi:hypothetical protein